MPLTIQTPLHLQRLGLIHDRHLIDLSVACRAADAFVHMNRMIEIREVRQVMHAHPLERLPRLVTRAHRFEIRTVRPNLFVAAHANRRRRNSRGRRSLHRRVTVTAIHPVVADVMLVTELNWLLALDVSASVPAGTVNFGGDEKRGDQNKYRAEDRGPCQIICAVTENLWHRRRRSNLRFRNTDRPRTSMRLSPLLNVTAI